MHHQQNVVELLKSRAVQINLFLARLAIVWKKPFRLFADICSGARRQ